MEACCIQCNQFQLINAYNSWCCSMLSCCMQQAAYFMRRRKRSEHCCQLKVFPFQFVKIRSYFPHIFSFLGIMQNNSQVSNNFWFKKFPKFIFPSSAEIPTNLRIFLKLTTALSTACAFFLLSAQVSCSNSIRLIKLKSFL